MFGRAIARLPGHFEHRDHRPRIARTELGRPLYEFAERGESQCCRRDQAFPDHLFDRGQDALDAALEINEFPA